MANNYSALLPNLIVEDTIESLGKRSAFIGRVYTNTVLESSLDGKSYVEIKHPLEDGTTVRVGINLHKEVNIAANMLESRVQQGNFRHIIELVNDGIVDGLVSTLDEGFAALSPKAGSHPCGVAGSVLTDSVLRQGLTKLAENNINILNGNVHLVVTPGDYYNGILGVDRYMTTNVINGVTAQRGGKITSLFNTNVDYSQSIRRDSDKPLANHNMLFEKHAFALVFVELDKSYEEAKRNDEECVVLTNPENGISAFGRKYYEEKFHTWYYQVQMKWGIALLDKYRLVEVLS